MPQVSRRNVLAAGGAGLVVVGIAPPVRVAAAPVQADLVVYGATSAGIVAAVQMRRMGGTVYVVEPSGHLGGLTTGGLGATDSGTAAAIGGVSGEFYRRIYAKYNGTVVTPTSPARYTFEPKVARAVYDDMIAEAGVTVHLGARLTTVTKVGNRITEIVVDNGQVYRGAMFVDATYEGDLLAKAGVTSTVGREANSQYGETINGVQMRNTHQFNVAVDPYVTPGSPGSGLLPGISSGTLAPAGSADGRIQAYNFRMCLTQSAARIPFPRPSGYDPYRYELLLRLIQAGYTGTFFSTHGVGGGKTDSNNNGPFSTDHIGQNYSFPGASYAARDTIVADHRAYQQGLMYFLANDPRVPQSIRTSTSSWGLAPDEFTGNGNWPTQLYVREARRMVSAYVMTEQDCRGQRRATDSVGLASYTMDSHNCQRIVVNGVVKNEGDVQIGVPGPYPVSYRSIVPLESQCANLLVPVCLSSSHIAYGSIRMEPVFMVLAQSAATAARLAIDGNLTVQQVPVATLQARLRADRQILQWPPTTPGEVILDSRAATGVTRAGTWLSSTSIAGYHGADYEHDNNANKGVNRLRFRPTLPSTGSWTVYLRWTSHDNRATNVPVDIEHAGGLTNRVVNQRVNGGQWVSMGAYQFTAGTAGSVLVRTEATDGYVVVDAVRFVPA